MWRCATAFWGWLADNKDQLVVLLTFAGVVAASVYAALTVGLWRAAKRQATTTRDMFEASYRPYFQISQGPGNVFKSPKFYSLRFALKAHGQVPAILVGYHLKVMGDAGELVSRETGPEWRSCLYPGEAKPSPLEIEGAPGWTVGADEHLPTVRVDLTVRYRGSHKATYLTRIVLYGSTNDGWRMVDYEVT